MIFGRLVCLFKGHRRGKFIGTTMDRDGNFNGLKVYACPRCGREKKYKFKPASVTPTKAAG